MDRREVDVAHRNQRVMRMCSRRSRVDAEIRAVTGGVAGVAGVVSAAANPKQRMYVKYAVLFSNGQWG